MLLEKTRIALSNIFFSYICKSYLLALMYDVLRQFTSLRSPFIYLFLFATNLLLMAISYEFAKKQEMIDLIKSKMLFE
jgi:hypothetical protein